VRGLILLAIGLFAATATAPAQIDLGEWTSVDEYNALVDRIPVEDRAWPLYAEAEALRESIPGIDEFEDLTATDKLISGEDLNWDEIEMWFSRNDIQEYLALSVQGSSREHLGFKLRYGGDPDLFDAMTKRGLEPDPLLPEPEERLIGLCKFINLGFLREAARDSASVSILHARMGRPELAILHLNAILGIATHARTTDVIIEQMVCMAILSLHNRTLLHILDRYPDALSKEHLSAIARAMHAARSNGVLVMSTHGECRMFADTIRSMTDEIGGYRSDYATVLLKLLPEHQHEQLRSLGLTTLDSEADHPSRALELFSIVPDIIDRNIDTPWRLEMDNAIREFENQADDFTQLSILMAKLFSPAWYRLVQINVMAVSMFHGTEVVAAIHLWESDHGSFPDMLDDLIPEYLAHPPIDAYTGNVILYKLTEQGPVVYSAGGDRDDDGGRWVGRNEKGGLWGHWIPESRIEEILQDHPDFDGDRVIFPFPR